MCYIFQLRSALLKVSKRAVGLATVKSHKDHNSMQSDGAGDAGKIERY